jgi:hypothetical protein
MFDEEERLRILERVSKGELTPEEGQLQIAMMKVKAQRQEPAVIAPEPEPQRPRQAPPVGPLLALLALPMVLALAFVSASLAFMLAIPVYAFVWLWNAQVVHVVPGAPMLAFWPSLGLAVLLMLLSGALRWGRSLQVSFMGFQGREQ